jgi:4-diphosphocytidyl-2-C-methyl-D-erythritol kinase
MVCEAPAKVNLRLEIVGRREDGYHLLQSIMVPLSLADELSFEPAARGVEFTCDDPGLPVGDGNLVVRAAKSLLAAAGNGRGARIHLIKRVPSAAGLGGGSSDAATTLLCLRDLFGLPVSSEKMQALALGLGADVPFFLARSACLVRGIGEHVAPYEVMAGLPLALVKPAAGLSTPQVYQALGWPLTRRIDPPKLPPSLGTPESICAWLRNDLEAPALSLLPAVGECKQLLRTMGALGVQMSGSGPTVFGIFASDREAVRARDAAQARGWWSCACVTRPGVS